MIFVPDEQQRAAIGAPLDGPLIMIRGASGSGKSATLRARISRASRLQGGTALLVSATSSLSLRGLQTMIDSPRLVQFKSLGEIALDILRRHPERTGLPPDLEIIDDVDAENLFERSAQSLLSMEWAEFLDSSIDPEVPGLRAPRRFCLSAFRLISKLRDAHIAPAEFLRAALHGAARFYGKPPNFAHPDLLFYTKDKYRDSLSVSEVELERQYRKELDLAKILERLYRSYLEVLVQRGCLGAGDAVAQASRLLQASPEVAPAERELFGHFFLDDSQELTLGELTFLRALCGQALHGTTFAGDPICAIGTFRGARPDRVFSLEGRTIELRTQHRSSIPIETASNHLLGKQLQLHSVQVGTHPLTLFRANSRQAEAHFIADYVVHLLETNVAPSQIAIIFRSVRNIEAYESVLLERNVDIRTAGDINLFKVSDVLDALALLWSVVNPFRHEWLLRLIAGPSLGLSDATLHTLCNEPASAQTLLFARNGEDEDPVDRRWDRSRDIRLAWNVTRGDQDAALSPEARERLVSFREMRREWLARSKEDSLPQLVQAILIEGLARNGSSGCARALNQQRSLHRLLDRVARYAHSHPTANLAAFLAYAELRAASESESCEPEDEPHAVRLLSLDATRGSTFDYIVVANARAGAFPRYYAPDAFLFSPSLGMIAKENVGDAQASRTAKFSYYMYRTKTREAYNREERRAFVYALRRARVAAAVTASERSTKGLHTPEFLSELQAARIPNCVDLTDRWKQSQRPSISSG